MIITLFGGKCYLLGEKLYQREELCPDYLFAVVIVVVTSHSVPTIFVWAARL